MQYVRKLNCREKNPYQTFLDDRRWCSYNCYLLQRFPTIVYTYSWHVLYQAFVENGTMTEKIYETIYMECLFCIPLYDYSLIILRFPTKYLIAEKWRLFAAGYTSDLKLKSDRIAGNKTGKDNVCQRYCSTHHITKPVLHFGSLLLT